MKKTALVLVALLVLGCSSAFAQFTITFDENGNSFYQVFNSATGAYDAPVANPGFFTPSPTVTGNALTYALPQTVGAGDVGILEFPGAPLISDGLRFLGVNGQSVMQFFSDPGDPDLADTGLPSDFNPSLFVVENGVEGGFRDFFFIAGNGNPATSNIYHGISDVVPEPGAISMVACGFVSLVGFGVRRRIRRR